MNRKMFGLLIFIILGVPLLMTQLYDISIVPCKINYITIHSRASISAGSPEYSITVTDVEGNSYKVPINYALFKELRAGDWVPIRIYRNKFTENTIVRTYKSVDTNSQLQNRRNKNE